ncbi:MAG: hypothetical protein HYZ34_01255 [Ignavibacteriae bacterium]|nr:hypothetical protein [Ignavibacteriota bacterium]
MISQKEFEEKSLTLSLEFSKYLLEHEELDSEIPTEAVVKFLPSNDPEYCEYVMRQAERNDYRPVVFVEFDGLQPERLSRMINPRILETEAV